MKILFLAFIWPEPTSSAAGHRFLQLITSCFDSGHEIIISSACQPNQFQSNLHELGIKTVRFEANDSSFDEFIKKFNPDIVIFDRFMIEEQFSWRVKAHCPDAVRILDSCDLHSLRRLRESKIKNNDSVKSIAPSDLVETDALREIASILRSDLTLIISSFEIEFLIENYAIPNSLIALQRFWYDSIPTTKLLEEREHFVCIGNFNHAPNRDSIKILQTALWPKIRQISRERGVNNPQLHVYGAYPTPEYISLNDPKTGFYVKGWTPDSIEMLKNYRVNLAPLRFGAGIKGKISDGWVAGTPCITTEIGSEGMHENLPFGGFIENDWDLFAQAAVDVYLDQSLWLTNQKNGYEIINALYNPKINNHQFLQSLHDSMKNKSEFRTRNIIGTLLWYEQFRSTEFFSRWIEAKNKHSTSLMSTSLMSPTLKVTG